MSTDDPRIAAANQEPAMKSGMKIVIVDDESVNRRQLKELCKHDFPSASVMACDSIFKASLLARVDVLIVDVSSVAGITQWEHAYAPICSFAERHPGCAIIITSAMSSNYTMEVIDEVRKVTGAPPTYGGIGLWEELKPKLKSVLV